MYTYTYIHIYVYIYINRCIYIFQIYTLIYIYTCIYMKWCIFMNLGPYAWIYVYMYIYISAWIYTYMPDFVINALGNFDLMSHSHHYMLWTSVDSLTWMYFEFLSYTYICVCICIYVCIYIQISIYTYLHSYNHMSSNQFKVSSHAYDSHYTWRDVCPYGRYLMCIFDMAHVTCDMAPIILRHDSCHVWHDLQ